MKPKAETEQECKAQVCMSFLIPVGKDINEDSLLHELSASVSHYYWDGRPRGDHGSCWVDDASDPFEHETYGRVIIINVIVKGLKTYPSRPLHWVVQCMNGIHEHLRNEWGSPMWSELVYAVKDSDRELNNKKESMS